MVTAPRSQWVVLERYPDKEDKTQRFVGRWNLEKQRWEDQGGTFRTKVHSWHHLSEVAGPGLEWPDEPGL